jgi:2-polyprenyl-3-methyl-5-hydroxy-6-metoxy-1,4-benzoquinol methylase
MGMRISFMPEHEPFGADDSRNAWNKGAEAWDEFVESGRDYYRLAVHGPALLETCGDVTGLKVLDLGCGQGYFSRRLALKGARVIGVDIAEKQIEFARKHEQEKPLGIGYCLMDAARITERWPAGSFDLVTACMSLHDMPDPGQVLKAAAEVLSSQGRMVYSVPHPFTDAPYREWDRSAVGEKLALKIDRYFEAGPTLTHWNMARLRYHWDTPYTRFTLAQMSAMTAAAGFLIRRIAEPRPTKEQVEENPDLDDCCRLPYFLILELVKTVESRGT